jgi:hypothetical protein
MHNQEVSPRFVREQSSFLLLTKNTETLPLQYVRNGYSLRETWYSDLGMI